MNSQYFSKVEFSTDILPKFQSNPLGKLDLDHLRDLANCQVENEIVCNNFLCFHFVVILTNHSLLQICKHTNINMQPKKMMLQEIVLTKGFKSFEKRRKRTPTK